MSPTFAIVFIAAAALIFVPLAIATNLVGRARNRGRLPSQLAMVTIALGLGGCLHNAVFIARSVAWGSDGVSGLSVVFALWSTMGAMILWGALLTRRVRLYRAAGAAIIPVRPAVARAGADQPARAEAPDPARSAVPTRMAIPAMTGADLCDQTPIVRLVYRDDSSPGVPCAPPLAMMRLPPTLREIVRAAPAVSAPATSAPATSDRAQTMAVAGAHHAEGAHAPLPGDVLATRTGAVRFAGRHMADAIRRTDRAMGTPGPASAPQFRSSRAWENPAVG